MAQIGNLGSLRVGVEIPIKDWNKNYKKITEDVKKYPKTTDKALKRAGKAWEKHAGTIKAASIGMIAFGTAAAVGFGMAVNEAATFQQSMVNTQAVAGATAEELKRLTSFAREMGKQTVFSAKESADAMVSLASAGQNTNEIMNSLKGTLNLAAATNSDLAFTSRTVASTLSQFGFAATESDRIANVFTATISASQATMDKLATSMSIVGPVAKAVGLSLEETAGILGGLFNAGLDASTAGTSLRQSLAQLLKPTDDAKEALGRLNVETLDSQGKLRNLTDIIADLEKSGLSAADALAIFGVRAGPGMLALVSQGADSIRDLTEAITGTDKAAEIAALMVETFKGQRKLLKSAVSELKITIGNELLPILTEYTTKLAGIINKTSDWAAENPKLTKTLVKLGVAVSVITIGLGGIGLAGSGIVKLGKVIKPVAGFVALFGSAAAGAGVKFTALGAAVTGVGVAAVTAGAAWWAYRRIQAAANKESDLAAISAKILKERQEDLLLALEQIGGALNVFEQTGNRVDATLQDLGIDAAKLTSVLGGNFTAADNAVRVYSGLIRNLERTSQEATGFKEKLEQLGPAEATAAEKAEALAAGLNKVKATLTSISQVDFGFLGPLAEFGFGEIPGDRPLIDPKERFGALKDVSPQLIKIRQDAVVAAAGIGLIEDAVASTAKTAGKLAEEIIEVDVDAQRRITELDKSIDKNRKEIEKKNDAFFKERDAKAKESRDTNLADAKRAMQEWQNSWGAVIGDVEGNFSSLYASIIDPSIEVGWKKFFGRFKDIAIQTAADILADATIKKLFQFGSELFSKKGTALPGGGTLADKIFGTAASAGTATVSPTASTSIGSIALGTKLGSIASAVAPAIIPIALAAAGFGIFAALTGGGKSAKEKAVEAEAEFKKRGVRNAEIRLRRLTDEEKEALREGARRRRPSARRKPPLDPRDPGGLVAARIASSRRVRIRAIVDDSATEPSSTPFVPRRPEGTDRFGRPLAATLPMAPARGGNVTFGDINIILPDVTDIRDMDSAEWERILRDNIQPAAEAIGLRFVRSDNLMAS